MTLESRINEAKDKAALDEVLNEVTPEIWELLSPMLRAYPPHAAARREGHESRGEVLTDIGTPSGNRFYALTILGRRYPSKQ
jgi:hypothetical protein